MNLPTDIVVSMLALLPVEDVERLDPPEWAINQYWNIRNAHLSRLQNVVAHQCGDKNVLIPTLNKRPQRRHAGDVYGVEHAKHMPRGREKSVAMLLDNINIIVLDFDSDAAFEAAAQDMPSVRSAPRSRSRSGKRVWFRRPANFLGAYDGKRKPECDVRTCTRSVFNGHRTRGLVDVPPPVDWEIALFEGIPEPSDDVLAWISA